jgi:hypothetical protein
MLEETIILIPKLVGTDLKTEITKFWNKSLIPGLFKDSFGNLLSQNGDLLEVNELYSLALKAAHNSTPRFYAILADMSNQLGLDFDDFEEQINSLVVSNEKFYETSYN